MEKPGVRLLLRITAVDFVGEKDNYLSLPQLSTWSRTLEAREINRFLVGATTETVISSA